MRGYREKMEQYRLPRPRMQELRAWCLNADAAGRVLIEAAAAEACGDGLAPWIVRHVTMPYKGWPELKNEKIPCGVDTFRVYRASFYHRLDRMLTNMEGKAPQGGAQPARKAPQGDLQQAAGPALAG